MQRSPLAARAGLLAALLLAAPAAAQTGYLQPPAPIPQILDAAPTPGVSVSPDHRTLALLG
ncbi:MAG TPA: hypothetical protein VFU47_09820, partial [Armatimonadota bacterium]|nr:hypothetical protein [Armatimonadota bacterium]